MTATIKITENTYNMIRRNSVYTFMDNARRTTDGHRIVEVGDEVFARISEHRMVGESIEDVLVRVMTILEHGKQ